MEIEPSWVSYLLLFFTPLLFFTFSIYYILRNTNLHLSYCNCEICNSYITSSWSVNFKNLCDWYSYLLNRSPSKTIQIHVLNNTITANPKNVEYMLKTNFANFPKGKPFSTILGDFLGRGIFNVDGELWKFQKKMACLELDSFSIRSFAFDIVNQEIEQRLIPLLASVSENRTVSDLQDVFKRFSFDSICKFSFGLDPKCLDLSLPISDFADAFDNASKLSAERAMNASPIFWKIRRFLNIGSEKKLRDSIKLINVLAKEVIRKKRKINDFWTHKDLLSRFMRTVDDETFLRDIVISFLLAGRDTVASGLTGFFWLIIKNPKVVDKILTEADTVLGSGRVPTSFEETKKLHYLQAAVFESMRLLPPIQFDSKFCLNDDVLPDGTRVKKGTRVTYHPYAMGRVEEIWGSDCLEFRPERWLKDDGVFYNANPFKFPVFQAGVRVCLGKEMSLVELKCVALSLIRRYEFKLAKRVDPNCDDGSPMFSPGLTATFRGGLPVLVRERNLL